MCHERWLRRIRDEREADRELWDEFERTRPLSDPEPAEEDAEVRLERPDSETVAAER